MRGKFLKDLEIDRYNLDEELVRQPQLYMEWALKAADAGKEVNDFKHDIDVLKAKIEKRIRRNPERYGLDSKPTEGAIKATIASHARVRKMTKKYLDALYYERILNDARTSFTQRRKMLEKLCELNLQLHFADVRLPQSVSHASAIETRKRLQRGLKTRKIKRRKK